MTSNITTKNATIRNFEDGEHNSKSSVLYKISTRKKIRNILIDCDYFENKGINSPKNITCTISIKVLGVKNKNKPIYWYELYGNTLNSKYNHIVQLTTDYEIPLYEGGYGYDTFKRIMEVVNGEFDKYTKDFIEFTTNITNGTNQCKATPEFVVKIIDDYNRNTEEKVISAN